MNKKLSLWLALIALPVIAAALLLKPSPSSREPLPEPVASKESGFSFPRFEIPIKPAPTPRSEKDEAIYQLSQQGVEPTAVALAAQLEEAGEPVSLELFLKAGVKATDVDSRGRPLLVIASGAGRSAEAITLLETGADPNAATPGGLTPLMAAARSGDLPLMQRLIALGAGIATADANGHTALHHAILCSHTEAAGALQEAGAEATPCCNGEKSLTLHALEQPKHEVLEAALSAEKPEAWHPALATALLEAARTGDHTRARLLIAHHDTAPPHPESRHPLLAYAVAWGDHDLLRLLLECGVDANTPLDSPVDEDFAALVPQKFMRYYLAREAGMTPLMLAAGRGDLAAVEALLEHGAKRNALTRKSRWPALSFAAQAKSVEVMQRLLGKSPAPEDQTMWIEISLASQTATLWKDNAVAMTTRVSTGRSGYRTPSGRFVITDKTRNRVSSIYRVNMPFFMRLNCSAIGMHAGNVPGYPASHGCIRVPSGNAAKLFRDVPVGTLVVIR